MKYALLALSLFLGPGPALADDPVEIEVPSDSKADYTLLGLEDLGGGVVQTTTKRVGPSGTSYAKRLFDCGSMRFKYLAEGDSIEELDRGTPSPNMGPLFTGSISYHVSRYACRAVGQ